MERLGLGVVGLGEGRSIISAGVNSDLWDVVQLCDLDPELRARRCREFGVEGETGSLDELLANPAVDVVGIYTPDRLHAEHVMRALRAGKHVICTKPFLDDLGQAQAVLDAQRASGKVVFVGQSARFFHSFARQRQHFESGEFGGLSHPVDLVRWYLPDITEVMGASTLSQNGRAGGLVNDDTFHFVLKSASGVIARVSGSFSNPTVPAVRDSSMTCILRAERGASQADYHDLRYTWRLGDRSVVEYAGEGAEAYYFRFEGTSHHAGEYQQYLEYVARCLSTGDTPMPDAREGMGTIALLVAMEEACRTQRTVSVDEILDRYGLEA